MDDLNPFLQPNNTPVANTSGAVSGYNFSTNYDRNSVTLSKIRNFSFNSGTGGTLTLGGSGNGNGEFILKNSGGSTIVTGDNTGITVTDGSITVKNASGSASLDSLGVVSVQNFNNVNTSQAAGLNQGITGTADTLITSGSLSVITSRAINVLFLVDISWWMIESLGTNTGNGVSKIKIDGSEVERAIVNSSGSVGMSTMMHYLYPSMAAGTHPFTITANVNATNGNGGTLNIFRYRMSYVLLGT